VLLGHDSHPLVDEVCDGDWLAAVGAWAAWADAAGEAVAVLAALFAGQSLSAVGALVDGVFAQGDRGGLRRHRR
jgi:hypothetical protein